MVLGNDIYYFGKFLPIFELSGLGKSLQKDNEIISTSVTIFKPSPVSSAAALVILLLFSQW